MGFLKAHWRQLVLGLVCLASIGAGGWAYMGGAEISEKLASIDKLRADTDRFKTKAANKDTIEAKEKDVAERNAEFEKSMGAALSMQKFNSFYEKVDASGKHTKVARDTLIPKVLPEPASNSDAIDFKDAYKRAYAELAERLEAGEGPTQADIAEQESIIKRRNEAKNKEEPSAPTYGASPRNPAKETPETEDKARTLVDVLNDYAQSRAWEYATRKIKMYLDRGAFGRHPLANTEEAPKAVDIWHAQMSLWIQQDIATALTRCNNERTAQLAKQGLGDEAWVARMPVKRLMRLRIADRLGNGGGSNLVKDWPPPSFTGITNNDKMFVIPVRLEIVIEQAALNSVLESICRVGFYTPINVSYSDSYEGGPLSNPIQDGYIYGDEPVIKAVIDFEGYFIRSVFEPWIPTALKPVLKSADAGEAQSRFRNGGG
jgi:hypothetical protein